MQLGLLSGPPSSPWKAPLLPGPGLQPQKHLLLLLYSLFNITACSSTYKVTGQEEQGKK